jgi:hypothetical protein
MQADTACMTGLSDVLLCISIPFLLVIAAFAALAAFLFFYFFISIPLFF